MNLLFVEENIYSVIQYILSVGSLPHISDQTFSGGDQSQLSSLLSGNLCSIKGDGQSVFKEEYCLKGIKTQEPGLDRGVEKAFLRKC